MSAHTPVALSDERIDHIANITARAMVGGISGFCRTWGYRQFARALLEDCAGHYRVPSADADMLTALVDVCEWLDSVPLGEDAKRSLAAARAVISEATGAAS